MTRHRFPIVPVLWFAVLAASLVHADSQVVEQSRQNLPLRPQPKQLPLPIIDECTCRATVFVQGPGGAVIPVERVVVLTDVSEPGVVPRDTCPSGARLDVSWHSEPRQASGYRYKLALLGDSSPFIEVGPNVQSASFDLGALGYSIDQPGGGVPTFTLGARGPSGSYVDSTRAFLLNYPPDTWWSGPDRNSPSLFTKPNGEKYALLVNGHLSEPILGSLMGDDSVQVMPASRANRRTFFEIWKDTVWVRQEGDTVHLNSWLVIHGGGIDMDSPYSVKVNPVLREKDEFGNYKYPDFIAQDGPVLVPGLANGSPIGFRSIVTMSLTPVGQPSRTALSGLYPIYDPNDVFNLPRIAGYHPLFLAGRAFAVMHAEDGDGYRDRRVPDGRELVIKIENGTATPYEQSLRPLVLTVEVDKPPYFVTSSPMFSPAPNATFTTRTWDLRLVANDDDPWQAYSGTLFGGPSANVILRRKIKVHGKDAQGNDFTYVDPLTYVNQQNISLTVPVALAPGPCSIEVELCDCDQCEEFPGSGRCVVSQFPVQYAPAGALASVAERVEGERVFQTALLAPYPNPASRGANIPFTLARHSDVSIEIYDVSGHRVRTFSESLPAGSHSRIWGGLDEQGRRVASGLYFVRLKTEELSATRKLLVTP